MGRRRPIPDDQSESLAGSFTVVSQNDEDEEEITFVGARADENQSVIKEEEGEEVDFTDIDEEAAGDDDEADMETCSVCSVENGKIICKPYRREILQRKIAKANRKGEEGHTDILNTLKQSGIRIFVVDHIHSSTVTEIMASIHNVIRHVSRYDRSPPGLESRYGNRCLLFRDEAGRFFNLTLAAHTHASEGQFKSLLDTFSGVQAMCLLTVLGRSFACVTESDDVLDQFKPAYLALILGMAFTEELSFSWLNSSMFVGGMPSISAYEVTSNVESDWLRKIIVFTLAMAASTDGKLRAVLTFFGIFLTCIVLLANLGARACGFLRWKPIPYVAGPLQPILAYLVSIVAGLSMPYLGHRAIQAGGKAAMESVLRAAFAVAVVFIISDHDDIQKFLVVGSEHCNQNGINILVGAWWTISLINSLMLVRSIKPAEAKPDGEESVLDENQASPVGFTVPNLPNFPIDPNHAQKGILPFYPSIVLILGMIMAVGIGGLIIWLAFTNLDEEIIKSGSF